MVIYTITPSGQYQVDADELAEIRTRTPRGEYHDR